MCCVHILVKSVYLLPQLQMYELLDYQGETAGLMEVDN